MQINFHSKNFNCQESFNIRNHTRSRPLTPPSDGSACGHCRSRRETGPGLRVSEGRSATLPRRRKCRFKRLRQPTTQQNRKHLTHSLLPNTASGCQMQHARSFSFLIAQTSVFSTSRGLTAAASNKGSSENFRKTKALPQRQVTLPSLQLSLWSYYQYTIFPFHSSAAHLYLQERAWSSP